MTDKDWLNKYLNYASVEFEGTTVATYKLHISEFLDILKNVDNYSSIKYLNSDHLLSYKTLLKNKTLTTGKQLQESTINTKKIAVRSFIKFLVDDGILKETILKFIKVTTETTPKVHTLSDFEITRIIKSIKQDSPINIRNRLMISLLDCSAVRSFELVGLNVNDLNLSQFWMNITGKKKRQRRGLISKAVAKELVYYIKHVRPQFKNSDKSNALFLSTHGNRFQTRGLQRMVKEVARKAGIIKHFEITPHVFRRSTATRYINAGKDPLKVGKILLGHRSLKTIKHYYDLYSFNKFDEVHRKKHPRQQMKTLRRLEAA